MNIVKKIKNQLREEKEAPYNITVTRSIVHNKRIAPEGHVFLIAKAVEKTKAGKRTWTLPLLVSRGIPDAQEAEIMRHLKNKLVDDITKAA